MADEKDIILNIEIKTADAIKGIGELDANIKSLKGNQEKLDKSFKDGEITLSEYNKQTSANSKELKNEETAFKNLTKAVNVQEGSINELRASTSALTKERNALNFNTTEGQKRLKEINEQIDKNNLKIKENVSSLEKQKINIGNYSSALDKISPGLSGLISGVEGSTTAAKAFIATPLGAILGAIGLALSALTSYFKGSEEGQRRLNEITQTASAIFEKFMDVVEAVGEAIYNAFTNPKQALIDLVDFIQNNLLNRFKAFGVIIEGIKNLDFKQVANGVLQFGSGIENVIGKVQNLGTEIGNTINKGIEQGKGIADLQEDIRKRENKYLVDSAKVDAQVFQLREKAITQEGDARRKTIEEAIALEKNLANQSIQIAEKKLALAKLELETKGNDQAAVKAVAEAEADLARVRSQGAQATIRFQKELERLNQQALDDAKKLSEQQKKDAEELNKTLEDLHKKAIQRAEREKTASEELSISRKERESENLEEIKVTNEESLHAYIDTETQRTQILIDAENERRTVLLDNADLTESEKQAIVEESDQKILGLQKDLNKNIDNANKQQENNEKIIRNAKVKAWQDLTNELGQIAAQGTIASKIAALGQIAIDTAEAISGLTANSEQNPANAVTFGGAGAIQFATGLVRILGNIAQAKKLLGFAEGGYTGPGGKYEPAGIVHKGEVVFSQRDVQMLGGVRMVDSLRPTAKGYADGGIVTSGITTPINRQYSASQFKMPTVVASWKEATELESRIKFKESITSL